MAESQISVRAIGSSDAHCVSLFLHENLNRRVTPTAWTALINPPWGNVGPNHGFQLIDRDDRIVGVYVAIYSTRDGGRSAVCNLAAFCVLEQFRPQALRLVRALVGQRGYRFTDLSPSGNVPAINERLGFRRLDTRTRLVLNTPRSGREVIVTENPIAIEEALRGRDANLYRDHRAAAATRHVLARRDGDYAYLMYRRDRRKGLPLFASPLYRGGDPALLKSCWPWVGSHLLSKGLVATLAERRVLGFIPAGVGRELARPRVKMYREANGETDSAVDYLYSELTLLEW